MRRDIRFPSGCKRFEWSIRRERKTSTRTLHIYAYDRLVLRYRYQREKRDDRSLRSVFCIIRYVDFEHVNRLMWRETRAIAVIYGGKVMAPVNE